MNTEQKCCPIHDDTHFCRYKVPGHPNSNCQCVCTCSHTEQKGWRSFVDYDELLLNADGPMDDETRFLKMRSITRKAAHDALTSYQEELVKKIEGELKEIPQTWKDKEKDWHSIPSPVMARVEFNYGIYAALSLIKDTKI